MRSSPIGVMIERRFIEHLRLMFSTKDTCLKEMMQNARRTRQEHGKQVIAEGSRRCRSVDLSATKLDAVIICIRLKAVA